MAAQSQLMCLPHQIVSSFCLLLTSGLAPTSLTWGSWSRWRESAPQITSQQQDLGSSTEDTWRTSPTTSWSPPSTPRTRRWTRWRTRTLATTEVNIELWLVDQCSVFLQWWLISCTTKWSKWLCQCYTHWILFYLDFLINYYCNILKYSVFKL